MTKQHTQSTPASDWQPETTKGAPIAAGDRLWWDDLNGIHAPRWVTDADEGLVICADHTGTHYMTVPEELT